MAEALSGAKKIVVCTIQTFPFALKAVRELAATKGKRFAVIADEAHSSQAGTAASNLKLVLSAAELAEVEDGGEVSGEDILAAQMAARADDNGITFVAFTATPKNKTMELFGTRPDPSRKPAPDNVPTPFHVYSMRQAIEEKFILDVLKNYTSYSLAFKLAQEGKEVDEREVERSAAVKKIMNWVKLHPVNVSQKVQIVVEHYRDNVAGLLSGKAKAMVVVSSRREAVKWKLAIEKYIKERGYQIGTLVAFSGEVFDEESGPGPFTEHSPSMNPKLKGDIRKAFEGGEYQVLLVANKFQTGFDQPLLCGMYVDKRLAGIQAVQTLSRLNRAYPGKDTTFVLDFVNDPNEVLEAVQAVLHDRRARDDDGPEPGLQPEGEAGRGRALRRVRGRPGGERGDRPEVEAGRSDCSRDAGGRPVDEAVQARDRGAAGCEGEGRPGGGEGGAERARCLHALQVGHDRVRAAVHVSVADLRLRQHGHREAGAVLQGGASAAGVRPRARGDRSLAGEVVALLAAGPGHRADGAGRGQAEAGAAHRGGQWQRAGAPEGEAGGDHREAKRAVRGRTLGGGSAGLRARCREGEAARVGDAGGAGEQQLEGAVRQLAGPDDRDSERGDRGARCAYGDEYAGAELRAGA
ncbi:MAG: hypothetical protein JNM69_36500 [Archangium sp.]|nr:hypothetical protein [Archangium sp.]